MTEIPKICFFCRHWVPDPGALDKKLQIAAMLSGNPDEVPNMYGKCRAVFIGEGNIEEQMNDGTLSGLTCNVYDYDKYQVFDEVPLG